MKEIDLLSSNKNSINISTDSFRILNKNSSSPKKGLNSYLLTNNPKIKLKKSFIPTEISKSNTFYVFNSNKNQKKTKKYSQSNLKLPPMENITFYNNENYNNNKNKIKTSLYASNRKINNKNKYNIKNSNFFPTSINETFYHNNNNSNKSIIKQKQLKTESGLETNKSNTNININNLNSTKKNNKFKEYQKLLENSSNIININSINLTRDINQNPFMRKIEDLNKINEFEIMFHNSIMSNIKSVYEKTKKGFFKIEHTTKDKNIIGSGYICENNNNIFNVSDMIERMNPISTLKFSKLLRKDYKEFLGYEKKKKKKIRQENQLRIKLIKKYHKELFFENYIADKYNIKKNKGIKFIIDKNINKVNSDDEDENKDDEKKKKSEDEYQ